MKRRRHHNDTCKKVELNDVLTSVEVPTTPALFFQEWNQKLRLSAAQISALRQVHILFPTRRAFWSERNLNAHNIPQSETLLYKLLMILVYSRRIQKYFLMMAFILLSITWELTERKTSSVTYPVQHSHHYLELQKIKTFLETLVFCREPITITRNVGRRRPALSLGSTSWCFINFIAPQDNCNMNDTNVKELFGSFNGKMKDWKDNKLTFICMVHYLPTSGNCLTLAKLWYGLG